jgi:hypothetical protein
MKFILTPLLVALGALIVIKSEWFVENFGLSAWAEDKFGNSGGTRLMYKFFGIIFIFGTMMWATGLLGPMMVSIFGKLFGINN